MTTDRMSTALDQPLRSAPIVDLLAPPLPPAPPADVPDDVVAALLAAGTDPDWPEHLAADFVLLESAQRRKREAAAKVKSLAKPIAEITTRLLDYRAEKQLDGFPELADDLGTPLYPHTRDTIWPKYRVDADTEEPSTTEEVIEALRACGYGEIITERWDSDAYTKLVRDRVKAWRQRCGEHGLTNVDGELVDHDGSPLTEDEAQDPTHDRLALPRVLRAVVEPVELTEIRFTRGVTPVPETVEQTADQAAAAS
jgi:hypothetical protein